MTPAARTRAVLATIQELGPDPHTRGAIRKALAVEHRGALADDLAALVARGHLVRVDGGWLVPPVSPAPVVTTLRAAVLGAVSLAGEITLAEVARRLGRKHGALIKTIARLAADGLIERRQGPAGTILVSTAPEAPNLQPTPGAVDPSPAAPAPPPEDPAASTPPGGPADVEPVAAALAGPWVAARDGSGGGSDWWSSYPSGIVAAAVESRTGKWEAFRPDGTMLGSGRCAFPASPWVAALDALHAAGHYADPVLRVSQLGVAGAILASQECERLTAELAAVTARAERAEEDERARRGELAAAERRVALLLATVADREAAPTALLERDAAVARAELAEARVRELEARLAVDAPDPRDHAADVAAAVRRERDRAVTHARATALEWDEAASARPGSEAAGRRRLVRDALHKLADGIAAGHHLRHLPKES